MMFTGMCEAFLEYCIYSVVHGKGRLFPMKAMSNRYLQILIHFLLCFLLISGVAYDETGCSVGCPSGTYESSPCSNSKDRVCSECTQCNGSSYEVRPCSPSSDRQCLHVAHPLLIAGEATTPSFLEEMKVEASENVFLEDLHGMRNLETTYYVTDRTQASDFYWDRESGLRVNIGILNIHLIPKYTDVDHESDNKYMLSSPNNGEDKMKFRKVVTNYCRNPIPDYYSITLEISRDRTTSAKEVSCDSTDDPSKPPCALTRKSGSIYLNRTLNEPCQKMGTFPESLHAAGNSIVCTENSDLLREVFEQTYSTERPIRFPSRKCRTALSRCEQCLTHPRCLAQDVFERKCCQIDCYTLIDCKQMVSHECTSVPVECAMGDAFRYTLQPVFQNIRSEFQCHLRHQKYSVLYELFYFIQIPGTGFQTPKVFKTVHWRDLSYQSRGEYQADYITVEHNTGLDLKSEFVLVGREGKNFTLHTFKMEDEYRRKKPAVHKISHNVFVASMQFERPFDYSTSSWVNENDCNKNISKMKVVQKHYGTDFQVANVLTQNSGDQFEFFLKSMENPPYLRFTVPGNMSILPYYFKNNGPYLLTKDSLKATLELTLQGRVWEIQIAGRMSSCPAYLGITINNRLELEELFRYDLLILCPEEFNVTFKVPNWGQQPDKTFDIRLRDAVKSYDIYLTQLVFELTGLETESGAMNVEVTPNLPLTIVAVLAGALFVLLVTFTIAYIYKEVAKAKVLYGDHKGSYRVSQEGSPSHRMAMGRQRMRHQRTIIGLYFIFWLVYSLTFTFTVLLTLLSMAVHSDIEQLSRIGLLQAEVRNMTLATSAKIENYRAEALAQQTNSVTSMQRACSVYIGELFESLAGRLLDLVNMDHLQYIYGANTSISRLFQQRTKLHLDRYAEALEEYSEAYRNRVTTGISHAVTKYYQYLQNVLGSDWFGFPQLLFNLSEVDVRHASLIPEHRSNIFGFEADFGSFLEIEEVEDMQLWPVQFWQRYSSQMPNLDVLPTEPQNPSTIHCSVDPNQQNMTIANVVQLECFDSSHFYAIEMSQERPIVALNKFASVNVAEEHRLFSSSQHDWDHIFADGIDLFGNISIDILRIVFLFLDALLLLYRFSHIYVNSVVLSSCCAPSDPGNEFHDDFPEPKLNGGRHLGSSMQTASDPISDDQLMTCKMLNYSLHRHISSSHDFVEDGCSVEICTRLPVSAAASPRHRDRETSVKEIVLQENLSKATSTCDVTLTLIAQVVRSDVVPKIFIFLCLLGVSFYIIIRAAVSLLNADVLLSVDVFGVCLGAINIQVNQTNWYLSDEAALFNEVTLSFYETQMNSELLNLETLLEYFNAEQRRLIDTYLAEACLIRKLPQVNWTCDLGVVMPNIEIPMLPCNFMPIQPKLYTDFKLADYKSEVSTAVQPFFDSAKTVVMRTTFAVVIAVSFMLIVNIVTSLLYHHFHTVIHRHHQADTKLQTNSAQRVLETAQGVLANQQDMMDYEGEEFLEQSDLRACSSSPCDVQPQTYTNSVTRSGDFSYSETKV